MASAAGHSLFWAIAPAVAVRVVDGEHKRFAIGMVAVGTSAALILGVPVGRMIGLEFGWRMPFLAVSLMLLAVAVLVAAVFPRVPAPGGGSRGVIRDLAKNRVVMLLYVSMIFILTGSFAMYSFIEPFLSQQVGLDDIAVTICLGLYGI